MTLAVQVSNGMASDKQSPERFRAGQDSIPPCGDDLPFNPIKSS